MFPWLRSIFYPYQQDDMRVLADLMQQQVKGQSDIMKTLAEFQAELSGVRADMTLQTTVVNSVKVFISGLETNLAAAIDKAAAAAAANGVPDDAFDGLRAIHSDLKSNTDALSTATTANTSAASEPVAPVVVPPAAADTPPVVVPADQAGASGSDQGSAQINE